MMVDTVGLATTPRVTPTVSQPIRVDWISWIEQLLAHETPLIEKAVYLGLQEISGKVPGLSLLLAFAGEKAVDQLIEEGIKALDGVLEKMPTLNLGTHPLAQFVAQMLQVRGPQLFAALGPEVDKLIAAGLGKIGIKV